MYTNFLHARINKKIYSIYISKTFLYPLTNKAIYTFKKWKQENK